MAGQQQQQQSGDNSLAAVWLCVALFGVIFVVWHVAHAYIVHYLFFYNIILAKSVIFFLEGTSLPADIVAMQTLDPNTVTWQQLLYYLDSVGQYLAFPVMLVMLILAIVLYRSDVTMKFRKTYTMGTFRAQEQDNWPAIMPVIKTDLVNTSVNEGPWAMALTPMEFAKKNNLLRKSDPLLDLPQPGLESTANIRRADAKRIFTLQLGPVWEGFDACAPHVKVLAAVFMARINRDQKAAYAILTEIDKTIAEGKPHYAVAMETLKKYEKNDLILEITTKHAYLLTVMASLLKAARDDGVVPASEFLWLKTVDRRLWFMLNNMGRQTAFVEVGGPFAHWKAEVAMGRATLVPMIDEAIKALDAAIKEVKLSPKILQELPK